MLKHYDEIVRDFNEGLGNDPGILSSHQIDQYHYKYFDSHSDIFSWGKSTYGGYGVPGEAYCRGCDSAY